MRVKHVEAGIPQAFDRINQNSFELPKRLPALAQGPPSPRLQ